MKSHLITLLYRTLLPSYCSRLVSLYMLLSNALILLQFNFVGRILGPRGITAKQLERDTGCKIMVRGKGSMRDKKKVKQLVEMYTADELALLLLPWLAGAQLSDLDFQIGSGSGSSEQPTRATASRCYLISLPPLLPSSLHLSPSLPPPPSPPLSPLSISLPSPSLPS